MLTCAKF